MQERKVCWDNFLLACPNCNGTKNNIDVIPDDYLWPHKDNTFLALTYSEGGVIRVSTNLSDALKTKAHNTIRLTGLDKSPTTNPKLLNDPARSDRRWENRREVWNIACDAKADLTGHDTPELRKSIITAALGHAYWSIWMTVFKDDADMCRRLIDAFVGTCRECFDEQQGFAPVPRLGGQI